MASIIDKIIDQIDKVTDEVRASGDFNFEFGHGEGIDLLFNGYLSYGHYVLTSRQLPNLEDGLKPVHQGILYTEKKAYDRAKGKQTYHKSAITVSDTMNEQHSHGDSSIYGAMTRLTPRNGSSKIPTYDAHGNMGNVASEANPASMRYTEGRLSVNALPLFDSEDGAELIESRANDEFQIFRVMPTRYPYAFVGMNQDGTAVGLSTSTPIYDVVEVADLVQEYLKTGQMTKILAPDYTTGCEIIQNTKEFKKLMLTGKGRVKMRGKVEIRKKDIIISNLPYGVTIEKLVREIEDLRLQGVTAMSGVELGKYEVVVVCGRGVDPQQIVRYLYAKTSLQKTVTHNSTYLYGGLITLSGLYDGIKKWVDWRIPVIVKKLTVQREYLEGKMAQYLTLVKLLEDAEAHQKFLSIFADIKRPEKDAEDFLVEWSKACVEKGILPEVMYEGIEFVMSRSLRALRNGGKYATTYDGYRKELADVMSDIEDPKRVVMRDMEQMKLEWGKFKRISPLTDKDYEVVKREDVPKEVTVVYKNGLLSRLSGNMSLPSGQYKQIKCMTNDRIVTGLSDGSIVTVRVSDIPEGHPSIANMSVSTVDGKRYNVLFCEKAEKSKFIYMYYSDGRLSFVNLGDFYEKVNVPRVRKQVLPVQYLDLVVEVGIWSKEIAEKVIIQFNNRSISWVRYGDVVFKESLSATSRLINFSDNVRVYRGRPEDFEQAWMLDDKYHGRRTTRIKQEDSSYILMQRFIRSLENGSK